MKLRTYIHEILKGVIHMKTFSEKIREERRKRSLTQAQFGELLGISSRMVAAYETGGRKPHPQKMQNFADILELPLEYLKNDEISDIVSVFNAADTEIDYESPEISDVTDPAAMARREMEFLKARSQALFAGGELPQESKDAFFQALYEAYLACREQAQEKDAAPLSQ